MKNEYVYLVETDRYIILTSIQLLGKICIFPCYLFDYDTYQIYDAADEIGKSHNKKIVDMINFPIHDPHIFEPYEIDKQIKNCFEYF